jgi:tetratricopeptide (TPR) repeat protein
MFRRVRFECGACGEGFVDWHDEEWERTPVFCVNCGEPIAAGATVDSEQSAERNAQGGAASALGVLKGEGDGFRDTLRGLRVDRPAASTSDAPQSTRDVVAPLPTARRSLAKATSAAPRANAARPSTALRFSRLAPWSTLLLGFALGVPLSLLAEEPLSRIAYPAAHSEAVRTRQMAAIAAAIDDGKLELARTLIERRAGSTPETDRPLTTLRARLALALILANRPAEAAQQLAVVHRLPPVHPTPEELQRAYDAVFASKPSSAAASAPAPTPATARATVPKPASKQAVLTFARDLQRRSQLDDAQRLYEAVLRFHPDDSEARCGLAEVQLLRGSVADAELLFKRALQSNPSYAPAWVGLADIDWLGGRPELAACRYRAVVERFPRGSYPPYIAQRIARVLGSGVNPPDASADAGAPNACGN